MESAIDVPYDLAVIGGGVNGAAIARDATGRGLSVLLLERGDLAQGTSSASTKLIHGGLRYLEHREFALVAEALHEREILWRQAPHIIWPMRFVLPFVPEGRPWWMLPTGLWLYDRIGGRKLLPPAKRVKLQGRMGLQSEIRRGYEYSDCWVDDARLVVLLARDAADRGAEVRTRCPVTALRREGHLWRIEAGAETFHAAMTINAAGPQVGELLGIAHAPKPATLRKVRGSHIVVPRLHDDPRALFLQLPDGRVCFAIPWQHAFTLIGTTDSEEEVDADPPQISEAEITYLLDAANRHFRRQLSRDDVVWTFAGVRMLADDGNGKAEAATRGYRFELDRGSDHHSAPLLSVLGGKITTHRTLAEAALERLGLMDNAGWTATAPLPGGDFQPDGLDEADNLAPLEQEIHAQAQNLSRATIHRLARAYGTEALGFVRGDMGRAIGQGFTEAELDHLVTREWAQTAQDVLWRRSKLGLWFSAEEVALLESMLPAAS
ncbi:MAG: glycerol-3-phosphate dehydrogenase [Sphingomonadales bacterium 39-62-4]|nr:MAG: glycerol-3-phosphate dehydrogenase [Sphingomonadales bacterium 39-62-4]